MEEIKAYKPKCCKKAYICKGSATRHEKLCCKNPDNKACITCGHFITDYHTVYVQPHGDQNYGDADYDIKYYHCEVDGVNIGSDYFNDNNAKPFTKNCKNWVLKEGE